MLLTIAAIAITENSAKALLFPFMIDHLHWALSALLLAAWFLSKANRVMVPACLSIRVRLTTELVWYWMRSARLAGWAFMVFLLEFIFVASLLGMVVGVVD